MRGCSIVWFKRNGEIGCKRLSKSFHFNGGSRGRKDSWHLVYGTSIILLGAFPSLVWHVTAIGTPGEDSVFYVLNTGMFAGGGLSLVAGV